MKELQLYKQNIDFKKVIDLAFERKDWGKTYTLFTYGKSKIDIVMESFNFLDNKAVFILKIEHPSLTIYKYAKTSNLEYHIDNFSLKDFNNIILKKCIKLIESSINETIEEKGKDTYYDLHTYYWNITDKQINSTKYKKEFKFIKDNIKDKELFDSMKESIQRKIEKIVNKKYYILLDDFKKEYKIDYDLTELKNQIKELI